MLHSRVAVRCTGELVSPLFRFGKKVPVIGIGFFVYQYGGDAYAGDPIDPTECGSDAVRVLVEPADVAGTVAEPLFAFSALTSAVVTDWMYDTDVGKEYVLEKYPSMKEFGDSRANILKDNEAWQKRKATESAGGYKSSSWIGRRWEDFWSIVDMPPGALDGLN